MVGDEEVNFERITKVYREESQQKALTILEPDFYRKLNAYVEKLEEELRKETASNPDSPKASMLRDELRKVTKKREQIFQYRERKIALLASLNAGGAEVELKGMAAEEKKLFEALVDVLKGVRSETFSAKAALQRTGGVIETEGAGEKEDSKAKADMRPVPSVKRDLVIVHILEDIPPFAGVDRTYRLKKEDIVILPKTIASVLTEKGKARIVEVAKQSLNRTDA